VEADGVRVAVQMTAIGTANVPSELIAGRIVLPANAIPRVPSPAPGTFARLEKQLPSHRRARTNAVPESHNRLPKKGHCRGARNPGIEHANGD